VCAGTRLVYDRAFLLECRNSPLANSPPAGLPQIPGVTCTISPGQMVKNGVNPGKHHHGHHGHHGHVPVTTASVPAHAPVHPKKPQPAGIFLMYLLGNRRCTGLTSVRDVLTLPEKICIVYAKIKIKSFLYPCHCPNFA